MPTMSESIIRVRDLSFAYRHEESWLQVLHGVDVDIEGGEVFGLVGESGCGKSTLAYLMAGYRQGESKVLGGSVRFRDEDLLAKSRPELDRLRGNRISFVPQNPTTSLSPHMRVGSQVEECLLEHRFVEPGAPARRRVAELLDLVGLGNEAGVERRYPHQLSGGQQQRICIAIALSCNPDLVILDEPTTGLDVTTQKQIMSLLHELRRKIRLSMLYVTHDLSLLAQIADRIAVMYAGHVVETAATGAVFEHARHPYSRGLIVSIPSLEPSRIAGDKLKGLLKRDELPAGCPFFPRCDYGRVSCERNRQSLATVEAGHLVACERSASIDHEATPTTATAPERGGRRNGDDGALLSVEALSLGYRSSKGLLSKFSRQAHEDVVKAVSFDIFPGETFALVGESGSGKSTIAKSIGGLLTPLQGRVLFKGRPLRAQARERDKETRRQIQLIFQNPDASLNPRSSIRRILGRPLQFFFSPGNRALARQVEDTLFAVRLGEEYIGRYPDQLSGGERQRIAIGRAIIARPDLLMCDEVLSALDVSVQAEIIDLLVGIQHETQAAMLFISHDLAVVKNIADRVGVLFRGEIMEIGATEELFSPPYHPYTFSLLAAQPSIRNRHRYFSLPADRETSLRERSSGCPYFARCPVRIDTICDRNPPPWKDGKNNLRIRCHHSLDDLLATVG